jgi:NADP-dependent aldehyde dehydrogenase
MPGRLKEHTETLAGQFIDSVNLGVGQFCTNPGLAFAIKSAELDQFINACAKKMKETKAGTMLHPGIKSGFDSSVEHVSGTGFVELVATGAQGGACQGQAQLLKTSGRSFINNPGLQEEMFGPASIIVECDTLEDMLEASASLQGNLTATIQATAEELPEYQSLISLLERKVGRIVFNGFPTGVEVAHAMVHGGPYPATTDPRFTSVGTGAIDRFLRPVCYQNFPEEQLHEPLQSASQHRWRLIDGEWKK